MDIQASFKAAVCVSAIAFLLYKTDAITQYAKLFRLSKFKFWNVFRCDYLSRPDSCNELSPLEYVKVLWGDSSFFASLVGCPYCLGFWLSIAFCKLEILTALGCYFVYIILYKLINKI